MANTQNPDAAQRRRMIAEAAYYRAKARGFTGGDPAADWLAAEREIERQLNGHGHEGWLKALEAQLSTGKERLASMKTTAAGKRKAVKAELRKDLEKLDDMLDSLDKKLEALKERGEKATRKARQQAEKIGEEISELVQRLGSRRK
jgi:chromosome segregation ATPase